MTWPEYPASSRFETYAAAAKSVEKTGADYVETIAREFPRTQTKDGTPVVDSVTLYRRLLANAADGSIVICAVGQLAGLAGLLDSGADTISPLSGAELARQKVRLLVTMALGPGPKAVIPSTGSATSPPRRGCSTRGQVRWPSYPTAKIS